MIQELEARFPMGVTSLQILQEKHPTEVQELFREIAVRLPKDSEESVGWKFHQQKHGFVWVKKNVLNMNGGWMGWDEIDAWVLI